MDLRNSAITGIVEVMDQQHAQARGESLSAALERLSRAREQRGPVGVLDPFEMAPGEASHDELELPRESRRRGLFGFSLRARRASEALVDDEAW